MRFTYILLFLLYGISSFCQEQLTGLQFNPVIKDKLREVSSMKSLPYPDDTIPISMPFFDDFSKNSVFPSSQRWIDRYGFENTDWPVNPVNIGVLTLDAINDSGSMYPDAVPGPETFIADHLTSRYIRLDSIFTPAPLELNPADSVYLSFFYQPQGRGSAPKTVDSLVLQFLVKPAYDSITGTDTIHLPDQWRHIWAAKGMPLDTFFIQYNRYFKQVNIPITDTSFFKKAFRFQFYNYVSLASNSEPSWQSNCCQWNIDNVYLNAGRSVKDTIYSEIRFIERPPSMLKNYQSMPYIQYSDNPTEEMIDTIAVTFRNRDSINHQVSYKYEISFPDGTMIKTYEPESDFLVRPYYNYNDLTLHPPVQFLYPISSTDSAEFVIKHFIRDVAPGSAFRDTITALQTFHNYYAYDDGTPEKGYGLTKSGSLLAYRFRLNKSPDTLRGVGIYFNKTLSKSNQQFFYLTVWDDNNGKPGDTIYSRLAYVGYSDSLYKFLIYRLEKPVRISGDFYVGIITTTDDNLNIGFDRYNNSQENLLFNSTGQWSTSAFSGSLMMRPLIGKLLPLGVPPHNPGILQLLVYPNPCSGETVSITNESFAVHPFDSENTNLVVRDLYGRELISTRYSKTLDVGGLQSGMYIIEVRNINTGRQFTGKLLITR
jgi:hypothetical protein